MLLIAYYLERFCIQGDLDLEYIKKISSHYHALFEISVNPLAVILVGTLCKSNMFHLYFKYI